MTESVTILQLWNKEKDFEKFWREGDNGSLCLVDFKECRHKFFFKFYTNNLTGLGIWRILKIQKIFWASGPIDDRAFLLFNDRIFLLFTTFFTTEQVEIIFNFLLR